MKQVSSLLAACLCAALLDACAGGPAVPVGLKIQPGSNHIGSFIGENATVDESGNQRQLSRHGDLILHNFGYPGDGSVPGPFGGLTSDKSGALYGTTENGGSGCLGSGGCGIVFKLSPHASTYTESILYNFQGGTAGANPEFASLIIDGHGALYGTTSAGGFNGYGVVYKLTPTTSGYKEIILHTFHGGPYDGSAPVGSVIADTNGDLYGTTTDGGLHGDGTVYKLTPKRSSYNERILISFDSNDGWNPKGNLLLDAQGALFGTTEGNATPGNVFELVPNGKKYKEHILYSFKGYPNDGYAPFGSLIVDSRGALYGTTIYGGKYGGGYGNGTVFKLTPVRGKDRYGESILYSFKGSHYGGPYDGAYPVAGVIADKTGTLYGTTGQGGTLKCGSCSTIGTVYKLVPSTVRGHTHYTESVVFDFNGAGGALPEASLLLGDSGALFGMAGGGNPGAGVVYELTP